MGLILAAVPPSKLSKIEGMNATCGAVLSYSTRHMARVESLLQKTFLFDLVLQSSSQGLALQDEMDLAAGMKSTMAVLLGPIGEADSDEKPAIRGPECMPSERQ